MKLLRGFSILEVLVAVTIFLFLMAAAFTVFISGGKVFDVASAQIEAGEEARRALNYMVRELRQTSPNQLSGIAQGGGSVSSVTFEIPYDVDGDGDVIDTSGVIEWSDDAGVNRIGTITYSLAGNQILRNLSFTAEQSVLANRITAVSFNWPSGTDIIEVSVTAEKYIFSGFTAAGDEKITITLNSQVRLRN